VGLQPVGDSAGWFQRVPLARTQGRRPLAVIIDAAADTFPAGSRVNDVNVMGMLRGSDPALRDEFIVVGAHFDHVGIREHPSGDSIFNGADDDASGVIALIEIARVLRAGPAPKRSVLFVAFTGEEVGLLGTNYYLAHPVVPLESTVAQLQIEMIGRPDSLAGGPGRAWLTGYERSTMGDMLAASGVPIVADPRPAERFFYRSDNIAFAYLGIPAHTLSTFGLHTDYHQPSDDVSRIDFEHMTAVIESAALAVRLLADGPRPVWHPGGRPVRGQ
jgi:Zn-dependent M28 family amino/carboxypeptidase